MKTRFVDEESVALRAAREIGYGSIAGMASKVLEHPFDLTKVRLQAQVLDVEVRFQGPVDCLKKTWKKEGVRGLYRGLPAPIVGAMAENASLFLSYTKFQDAIRHVTQRSTEETLPLHFLALAGAGAGATTSFILTPIELVKCKMQVQMLAPHASGGVVQKALNLPGPISVLTTIIRTQGLGGLWLGHTGTLIRETGGTAAWFSTKEYIASLLLARRRRRRRHQLGQEENDGDGDGGGAADLVELKPWESALSGACAGVAFNLAMFPADTVKSAMQTEEELRPQHLSKVFEKLSFSRTFMAMYRSHGIPGLYAGCGVTIARSIPSSGLIFLIYDGLKKYFA